MDNNVDVVYNVTYNEKFVTSDGELGYVGGLQIGLSILTYTWKNAHDAATNIGDKDISDENEDVVNIGQESLGDENCGLVDEELRIQEHLADFIDDSGDESYEDAPPRSDEEVEEQFERWKKGSGELKILQVFDSVEEFKEAVLDYSLKGGWNLKYTRWGDQKSEARCAIESDVKYPWRIYCSFEEIVGKWMIKTYQEEHTCFKDGRNKLVTENVIAKFFINDVRNDPELRPKIIQQSILKRYNVVVTHDQCRKAKTRMLGKLQDEHDKQFARLNDYQLQILDSDQGSSVDLRTVVGNGGLHVFDKFYVCFEALRSTWRAYCRPIVEVHGCFLKSTTKGQLLTAVGRDANNQVYPIAWAIVQVENTEGWLWFIKNLKSDLNLGDGDGFTLISDRQKGLFNAVQHELPKVEHRMCARHIYGNLRKFHSSKPKMKKMFWKVSNSYNMAEFEAALHEVKVYDKDVYDVMMSRNPQSFSRVFFKADSCCEDALNNFSESYNFAIDKARALPLVEMLETIRRQAMLQIDLRKQKTMKHKGKFSAKVGQTIALEEKERQNCRIIPGGDQRFEVIEHSSSYQVNMRTWTCACRRWDLTGILCRHALRVIQYKKWKAEDFVSHWYLTSTLQSVYNTSIKPLNGMKFWRDSSEPRIQAPLKIITHGRKKKPQKTMKGINESPSKDKKVTKVGWIVYCENCGIGGHNARKCVNTGVEKQPRKKARSTHTSNGIAESQTLPFGEGSSQP